MVDEAKSVNPLQQLEAAGQSPWLDFVRRSLIERGEIAAMVAADGLKGMTSNPSIFEKGIGESDEYTALFNAFLAGGDRGVGEIYEHLAVADIQGAADALHPVFARTAGRDGYISLEVSPYLARDAAGTVAEAHRLAAMVARPNLMVKVPATPQCIPAIGQLIADGLNINVTLLFSVSAYEAVADAYISGLERRAAAGLPISSIASVASFFVSRIDVAVEKALAGNEASERFRAKVAIANAKLAYQRYLAMFSGPRWQALAAKGAMTQRLLWASTGTKAADLSDVLYVETLIGKDTVNTMPPATMDAFRDHGRVQTDAIEQDVPQARALLDALAGQGVSLDAITTQLVDDGVRLFADSFDALLGAVARRRRLALAPKACGQSFSLPRELQDALDAQAGQWRRDGRIRQLWAGASALWTGADEGRWLGWLDAPRAASTELATLQAFAARLIGSVQASHVVLLGMGGSSLGPEVLAETFSSQAGWPRFHMLDSTDPQQIAALDAELDLARTIFIVSSKSGSTLEPSAFLAYFLARARATLGAQAGGHFVAVTDPGSKLESLAKAEGFAACFAGTTSIGGRYSVLSPFGLVPAALMGLDLPALVRGAQSMAHACGSDVPPAENPGVQLGLLLGAAGRAGFDKVTFLSSPALHALGAWLEQLIAESTGKHGHGLLPVDGEPVGVPGAYGTDRLFIHLTLLGETDEAHSAAVAALAQAGHPVARIVVPALADIGGEFFRWELATAVAGAVLGINPFDQPDVEASKIKTLELTRAVETSGTLPAPPAIFSADGLALFADPANAAALGTHDSLQGYLRAHFARAGAGDYIALLAYLAQNSAHIGVLQGLRLRLRDRLRVATNVQFGPRFLHSTGQLYKGGPKTGLFLQITAADAHDIAVPDHRLSFGTIKAAQAQGDFTVLCERGRRALHVHLDAVEPGLQSLARAVELALD